MKNLYRFTNCFLFFTFLITLSFSQDWTTHPVPIAAETDYQANPFIMPSGSGGAMFVWEDNRSHVADCFNLYAQRVNSEGSPQWAVNGVPLGNDTNPKAHKRGVSDGNGGMIVVWQEDRGSSSYTDIMAQRITSDGTTLWGPQGTEIVTESDYQEMPRLAGDGNGGAVIAWISHDSTNQKSVMAQRINGDAVSQWTLSGVAVGMVGNPQSIATPVYDSTNGTYISWVDSRSGTNHVYAQRLDSNGVNQWDTNGISISSSPESQTQIETVPDGTGGFYAAWLEPRYSDSSVWLVLQRVNSAGSTLWNPEGVWVSPVPVYSGSFLLLSDENQGLTVTWTHLSPYGNSLRSQRYNSSGTPLWPSGGVTLTTTSFDMMPSAYPLTDGGLLISWSDYREPQAKAYIQKISSTGALQWIENGFPVFSNSSNVQTNVVVTRDAENGGILAWTDRTDSGNWDVYAARAKQYQITFAELSTLSNPMASQETTMVYAVVTGANSLSYQWSSLTGTFINATRSTTQWIAPMNNTSTTQHYLLSLTVSDVQGNSTTVQIDQSVNSITDLLAVKAFTGQSFSNLMDLRQQWKLDSTYSFMVYQNFFTLANLSGDSVSYSSLAFATTGQIRYYTYNSRKSFFGKQKIKYSTYKIRKLPHVGLRPGQSESIEVSKYTYDSTGIALPNSYGNSSAAQASGLGLSAAFQTGNSWIKLTADSTFSAPGYVDILASPNDNPANAVDVDRERISVYPNVFDGGTFSSVSDLFTQFGVEKLAERPELPVISWVTSATDSAGETVNNVLCFTFSGTTQAIKATGGLNQWLFNTPGEWYIARMKVYSPQTSNTFECGLFYYQGYIPAASRVSLVGNIYLGVPNQWTWIEAPLYTYTTSYGYPQFVIKGNDPLATLYLADLQVIQATPELFQGTRALKSMNLESGQFDSYSQFTQGWGAERLGVDPSSMPELSVTSSGRLAVSLSNQYQGVKVTAIKSPGQLNTPQGNPGYEVGLKSDIVQTGGQFNSYTGLYQMNLMGVQSPGQYEIFNPTHGQIGAAAQFGYLTNGTHYLALPVRNPYHQFQFMVQNDKTGVLEIDNFDFYRDTDNPNFGDYLLFP